MQLDTLHDALAASEANAVIYDSARKTKTEQLKKPFAATVLDCE